MKMALVVKYVKKDGTKVYGSSTDNTPIPQTPARPTPVKNRDETKVVAGRTIKATRPDAFYEPTTVIRTPEQIASASRYHVQSKLQGAGYNVSPQQAAQFDPEYAKYLAESQSETTYRRGPYKKRRF